MAGLWGLVDRMQGEGYCDLPIEIGSSVYRLEKHPILIQRPKTLKTHNKIIPSTLPIRSNNPLITPIRIRRMHINITSIMHKWQYVSSSSIVQGSQTG